MLRYRVNGVQREIVCNDDDSDRSLILDPLAAKLHAIRNAVFTAKRILQVDGIIVDVR